MVLETHHLEAGKYLALLSFLWDIFGEMLSTEFQGMSVTNYTISFHLGHKEKRISPPGRGFWVNRV